MVCFVQLTLSLQTLTILKEFSLQYKRFFSLVHLFPFFLGKGRKSWSGSDKLRLSDGRITMKKPFLYLSYIKV